MRSSETTDGDSDVRVARLQRDGVSSQTLKKGSDGASSRTIDGDSDGVSRD